MVCALIPGVERRMHLIAIPRCRVIIVDLGLLVSGLEKLIVAVHGFEPTVRWLHISYHVHILDARQVQNGGTASNTACWLKELWCDDHFAALARNGGVRTHHRVVVRP